MSNTATQQPPNEAVVAQKSRQIAQKRTISLFIKLFLLINIVGGGLSYLVHYLGFKSGIDILMDGGAIIAVAGGVTYLIIATSLYFIIYLSYLTKQI